MDEKAEPFFASLFVSVIGVFDSSFVKTKMKGKNETPTIRFTYARTVCNRKFICTSVPIIFIDIYRQHENS